ncbi:MAG TPA: hypothetical protein VJX67_07500, partial [Blastocatellia bacterium]|nr:hypothetical protein [Blastocatellia bacterium]
ETRIAGPVVLRNGDRISIGDACSLTVHMASWDQPPPPLSVGKAGSRPRPVTHAAEKREAVSQSLWSSKIALISGLAVLGALAFIALILFGTPGTTGPRPPLDQTPASEAGRDTSNSEALGPRKGSGDEPGGGMSRAHLEEAAQQILTQISDDSQAYDFPPDAIGDISAKVEQYRESKKLAAAMSSMAPDCERLAGQARPFVTPALVIYAAMTDVVTGRTDVRPAEAAQRCIPLMTDIWKLLGNRTGDEGLLLIAAYRMGPVEGRDRPGGKSHPLLAAMRRVSQGVGMKRTVWYLYKNNGIDKETYEFVVSFLAIAVLTQHPAEFGISAPALTF